jgi:hypothetical protein
MLMLFQVVVFWVVILCSTQHHNPADELNLHHCENLKSDMLFDSLQENCLLK